MNCGGGKKLSTLIYFLVSLGASAQNTPDTVSLTKPDSFYVDHSDRLLIGAGYNLYNYTLIFRNISANLVGDLYQDYSADNFPVTVNKWKFTPSVMRQYASAWISCRYGSFSQSRSVDFNAIAQTKMSSFQFTLPYKKLSLTFDYIKFTGMNRLNPVNNNIEFLPGMTVRPLSVMLEYTGGGHKYIRNFSSLRNYLLYTPKKSVAAFSFLAGYSDLLIKDKTDFIPGLQYANALQDPYAIQEVKNSYLHKFTSQGARLGFRASYFIKLYTKQEPEVFHSVYIRLWAMLIYNVQGYQFYSLTNNFNNAQFTDHQKGVAATTNMFGHASLVFDLDRWFFSAGANYYSMLFGSPTGSVYDGNSVRDERYSFQANVAYRLPFARVIRKVNKMKGK